MAEENEIRAQAENWLAALDSALTARDVDSATALFGDECFWRDLIAFTWNVKTLEGRDEIADMLRANLRAIAPSAWRIDGDPVPANGVVETWLRFETKVGRGRGIVRLKGGRAWTLLTTLEELKGFEERKAEKRPTGTAHGVYRRDKTWLESKQAEEAALGMTKQPYCVIIGGGQGGIALGARLKQLDVPTIIVEKNARPGDSWRNRYRSLVLHDPVWYDHLPYIPFPENWPVFTPKDKIGDWLEMYAKVMELNYWGSAECIRAAYDDSTQEWTVEVRREGKPVTLKPKQLVFATGAYGPPNEIPLPGIDEFQGEHYHSSGYSTGEPYQGKCCIVVGANSSAHDIAADLWEYGAKVTMLQRSPTTVVRSGTLMELAFKPLYSENAVKAGITTDKADLLFAATPFRIMPRGEIPLYQEIRRRDAAFYEGLCKSGFRIDFGEDEFGPDDEGDAHRLRILHRCRSVAARRQWRHRGAERGRNSSRQCAVGRADRRRRAPCRSHRDGDWVSIDEPGCRADHVGGSRGHNRQMLGSRLGCRQRPRPVGRRAAQHVETDATAGPVVSWRQPAPLATLFAVSGAAA